MYILLKIIHSLKCAVTDVNKISMKNYKFVICDHFDNFSVIYLLFLCFHFFHSMLFLKQFQILYIIEGHLYVLHKIHRLLTSSCKRQRICSLVHVCTLYLFYRPEPSLENDNPSFGLFRRIGSVTESIL